MDLYLKNCLSFLDAAPSPFHAAKEAATRLEQAGYALLSEGDAWKMAPGGKYYTVRNGSSVIAWKCPKEALSGWRSALSHSDSPAFRISETNAGSGSFGKARIEEYGGPRLSTWMDRPLKAAGRLFVKTADGIESVLVETGALLIIPTLCCHFDREGRTGGKLNMSADLQPITGSAPRDLMDAVKSAANLPTDAEIVGFDLVLALTEKATVFGLSDDLFVSPRIDDLAAAAASLDGFLSADTASRDRCDLWCMFDNEEVGSATRQGAGSMFLADVMRRIEEAFSLSPEDALRARANAFFLSIDNAHATHPNHPEASDPAHPIALNGGVVVKLTANQRYTSTAMTAAIFEEVCRRADVPTQLFYNRPDVLGGGTLGNILSQKISVPMVDIGLPQLSMHSAMETAGTHDVAHMVRAVAAFFNTSLTQTTDGNWRISCD